MADTVASLGIEVTAKGADKASTDLDKLTASTKGAAKATEDFASTQRNAFTGGRSAAGELANQAAKQAEYARTTLTTAQAATTAARETSLLGSAMSGIGNLFRQGITGADGLGSAHLRLRDATRAVSAGLREAGGSLGVFGSVLLSARTGLTSLALVAGATFLAAMEKAADSVIKIKDALAVLSGTGATKAFENIKLSADGAKASMTEVYNLAVKLATLNAQRPQTFVSPEGANSSSLGGANLEKESANIKTLLQGLQLSGITASEAGKQVDSLIDKIGKDGKLTGDIFREILKTSPQLAQAIAQAGGSFANTLPQLVKYSQELDKQPKSLSQFEQILTRIAPVVDKFFQEKPSNLAQSFDRVKTAAENFFSTFGSKVGISSLFDTMAAGLNTLADNITKGGIVAAFNQIFKIDLPGIVTSAISTMTGLLKTLWDSIPDGAKTALAAVGSTISQIVQSVVSAVGQMVQAALAGLASLAQRAAASAGGLVRAGAAAANSSLPGGDFGPSFQVQPGSVAAGFDAANPGFDAGFATGGSFVVGGSGGTDSTPVSFMATKGEIVTITPQNLIPPQGLIGASNASLTATGGGVSSGAGQPSRAIAGVAELVNPIVDAVNSSADQISNAVGSSSAAVANSITTIQSGLLTSQGVLSHTSNAPSGSAAAPIGSGPVDAYGNTVGADQATYVSRINHNSSIAGSAPGGNGQLVYATNPNYGKFAMGGSFMVGGSGGTDTSPVSFMATKGEQVTVTPPNTAKYTIGTPGKDRPININVFGAQTPAAFIAAEAQVRRRFARSFR
jgi:hypothetical protein